MSSLPDFIDGNYRLQGAYLPDYHSHKVSITTALPMRWWSALFDEHPSHILLYVDMNRLFANEGVSISSVYLPVSVVVEYIMKPRYVSKKFFWRKKMIAWLGENKYSLLETQVSANVVSLVDVIQKENVNSFLPDRDKDHVRIF